MIKNKKKYKWNKNYKMNSENILCLMAINNKIYKEFLKQPAKICKTNYSKIKLMKILKCSLIYN